MSASAQDPTKSQAPSQLPKTQPKLAGQHNDAEWISMTETALTMYDIEGGTIWDIVAGMLGSPIKAEASSKAGSAGKKPATLSEAERRKVNYFAILTMKKELWSCNQCENRNYQERAPGIQKPQGKLWGEDSYRLRGPIGNLCQTRLRWPIQFIKKNFGKALREIIKDDEAKAEFLLLTLPPFYNTLVENLQTNATYTYGNIVRQLILYVSGWQKKRRTRNDGTQENPVVLKTNRKSQKDNGKRRDYYIKIERGWTTLSQNVLPRNGMKEKRGNLTKQRQTKPRNWMVGHQYAISW